MKNNIVLIFLIFSICGCFHHNNQQYERRCKSVFYSERDRFIKEENLSNIIIQHGFQENEFDLFSMALKPNEISNGLTVRTNNVEIIKLLIRFDSFNGKVNGLVLEVHKDDLIDGYLFTFPQYIRDLGYDFNIPSISYEEFESISSMHGNFYLNIDEVTNSIYFNRSRAELIELLTTIKGKSLNDQRDIVEYIIVCYIQGLSFDGNEVW